MKERWFRARGFEKDEVFVAGTFEEIAEPHGDSKMTQKEYLAAFRRELAEEIALTERKNADYSDAENAFANFELIEKITGGRLTAEDGLLVRMSDKFQRLAHLLVRDAEVQDETVSDTLRDLGVYAKILKIRLDSKKQKRESGS